MYLCPLKILSVKFNVGAPILLMMLRASFWKSCGQREKSKIASGGIVTSLQKQNSKMYAVPSKVWYEPLKIRRQWKTGGCVPKKHHCHKCLRMVPSLSGDFWRWCFLSLRQEVLYCQQDCLHQWAWTVGAYESVVFLWEAWTLQSDSHCGPCQHSIVCWGRCRTK